MKKVLVLILSILFGFSCNNNSIDKPKKPDNLMSKDKMVDVLYDMAIVSSAKGVNRKLMESKGIVPEDFIFEKYNIDSTIFAQSNDYYAYDIKEYTDIYNRVKLKLDNEKEDLQAALEIEDKEKDSLNKIKIDQRRAVKDSLTKNNIKPTLLKSIDTSQ